MADSVYKVIELVGTSTDSWERARGRGARPGVRVAARPAGRRGEATRCGAGRQRREDLPGQAQRLVQVRRRRLSAAATGLGASDDASDTLPGRWTSATRPPSSSSAPSSASGSPTCCPALGPEPHRDDWDARRAWDTGWQRMLFDAGYAGINWPKEFGGRGATPTEHLIFIEETERARAPYVGMNFVGLLHAGPTLIAEASDEQKAFHLPGILKGEHVWCQGFSEPNAGSDLASLRCRAVRDGDDYVINGQKIWTSYGHMADYCEMLVRTDPEVPKHKGITWLIVPMDTPGIDIRPLETMEGTAEFCEVFFDDVRVPVANRVGDENDGWRVAEGHAQLRARHRVRVRRARVDGAGARPRRARQDDHQQRRDPLGGRRPAPRARSHRRRVRRAVGAHQAQHLAGATHRARRRRRQRVQDRVVRPAPAPRRRRHAPPRPRVALARRRRRAADRAARARALLRAVDDHRRGHVAGAAQHRRRARARPARRTR